MTLFNEFMVSIYLFIVMPLQMDDVTSEVRRQIGWPLIAVIMVTVLVNIIKAAWYDTKGACSRFR
jgi:NADH:ubiquinone oxidoreductase subunit 6 (subunit J)